MDLQLDFGAHLPKHLCPNYNQVVSLLNQTVVEWPKGSARLVKGDKGVFNITVWDKERAAKLKGKKIDYFYDEPSNKKVSVKIQEKPKTHRYTNPKYVTMVGFERFPCDQLTNSQIDNQLKHFGELIIETQDIYAKDCDIFTTGKKKARIDLNKGKDIPRDWMIEVTPDSGKKISATIRCYYYGQPWKCKRCDARHIGDCPEWEKEKLEAEKIKDWKEKNTKTAMIGDSNLRCVNERGVMATVTSITGGKIGHIVNQLKFENLEKVKNIIISAGQNCTNDIEETERNTWETKTKAEIAKLEAEAQKILSKGKNVFVISVPPVPIITKSKERKRGRQFINNELTEMVKKLTSSSKSKGTAALLDENDGNFNPSLDFTDDRHLAPIAIERLISNLDTVLPAGEKLKNPALKGKPTCYPYRGCYGSYPTGCLHCTGMSHNIQDCVLGQGAKRPLSTGGEESSSKKLVTGS